MKIKKSLPVADKKKHSGTEGKKKTGMKKSKGEKGVKKTLSGKKRGKKNIGAKVEKET